ncbi:MAG TPA: AmmeMemoRadiSam system protein B [Verrucomicrobiae bacterium]
MKKTANPFAAVRVPAVAGQFYPRDASELRGRVEDLLRQVKPCAERAPKAIIVPHAGYQYSGPIAASAYARLIPDRAVIRRVVLLGPSHHLPFFGLATTSFRAFETPLGLVPVDAEMVRWACALPEVSLLNEAHAHEHSLEVQLPFLQVVLDDFQIVPLVAGYTTDQEVAEVMVALWGGAETRFVISSDLSHYLEYAKARELDAATSRSIEALRAEDISETQACGMIPVRGLLRAARQQGLRARTIDLRNSGDTGGPRTEVVGYGAFVFQETPAAVDTPESLTVAYSVQ